VEIVSAAVIVVGTGLGNRVDHAAGAAAKFSRVVIGQNRELADSVDAHVHVQGAPRAAVGMVIDHQSVDTEYVLRHAPAGNGNLQSIAILGAGCIRLWRAGIV